MNHCLAGLELPSEPNYIAPTGVLNINGTIQKNGSFSDVNSAATQQPALSVTGYSTHVNKLVIYCDMFFLI
jgi:hypothetical protein